MKNINSSDILLFLLMLIMVSASPAKAQPADRLNVLLFVADDMTWRDTPVYGNNEVQTPHLSKLAEEGMRFDNMYTSTAMCSPTRQQLYTGLFPVRSGAYPNHSRVYAGVKSLPHYFKDLGYNVALVGKRHYGPPESYPFDFLGGRHHDNGDGVDIHIDKIKPHLNQPDPFFIVVATNQPHSPWNRGPAQRYQNKELTIPPYMVDTPQTREQLARYYGEITYADSLLGRSMQLIEQAGKTDNTIVIFTSEQGSSFPFAKWTTYDLGLKTGFVVRWPGGVPAGTATDAMAQYVDVVPTLLEAVGDSPGHIFTGSTDARGHTGFDGRSFLKILTEGQEQYRQYTYGVQTTRGIFSGSVAYPIRSVRTDRYKYILNLNSSTPFFNTVTARTNGIYQEWLAATEENSEKHKFVLRYKHRPKEELYDIREDPYEMHNLADDPEYMKVKQQLAKQLGRWMRQQGDEGIDTELGAIQRQPRWKEEGWNSYEEQQNNEILNNK